MLAMVYFWLYSCTVQTRQRGGWRQLVLATSPWAMDDSLTLGQHLSAPRRRLPWPTCDLQTVPNGPCQNDRLPRCSQMWWTIWQWQMPAPEVSWRHLAPLRMGQTWGGQPELRRPTWADVPTASCLRGVFGYDVATDSGQSQNLLKSQAGNQVGYSISMYLSTSLVLTQRLVGHWGMGWEWDGPTGAIDASLNTAGPFVRRPSAVNLAVETERQRVVRCVLWLHFPSWGS